MRILVSSLRFLLLIAALAGVVAFQCRGLYPVPDLLALKSDELATVTSSAASVAATLASVAATMLGFLIAALAILASVANMRLLRNMQRTGHYQVLLIRLLICAVAFGVLLAFSLVALFAPVAWPPIWACIFGVMAAAAVTFIDAMHKFASVLLALKPASQILE